jgi:hypothetical protein
MYLNNLFEMLDISDVPEYFNVNMLSNYKLAEIGIPLERFSEDKARVNKYGQKSEISNISKRLSSSSTISLTLLVLELKSPANAIFL